MKTLTEKYNGVLKGLFNESQFLRDARMEFPNLIHPSNDFKDVARILQSKGVIAEQIEEEQEVKEASQPIQLNIVFKDTEDYIRAKEWFGQESDFYPSSEHDEYQTLSFEVADQADADATEMAINQELQSSDIQSWSFELMEGIHDKDILSAPHTNIKTPPKGTGDYDPARRAASLKRLANLGPKKNTVDKEIEEGIHSELKRNDIVRHIPSGVEVRVTKVGTRLSSGVVIKAGNLSSKLKVGDIAPFRNIVLGTTWEKVNESLQEEYEAPKAHIPLDVLDRGIRFELSKQGLGTDCTADQYEKAKTKATKNLEKDLLFYKREEGAAEMPVSKTDQMVKMKIKEGVKVLIKKILSENTAPKMTFTKNGKVR